METNGLGKLNFDKSVMSSNGNLNSLDYQNFMKLPIEKQQEFASKGLKFDDFGNTYGVDKTSIDSGSDGSLWGGIKNSFTPGEGGHSVAGNMLKGASDVVGVAGGLGSLYFANKNYNLQKDQADYLKNREAQQDSRLNKFAANAGNGASYG